MRNKAALILLILLGTSLAATFIKQAETQVPGDLTGDGKVNLTDLVTLAFSYRTKPGDEHWNPNADFNNNGEVDLADLVFLSEHWTGN